MHFVIFDLDPARYADFTVFFRHFEALKNDVLQDMACAVSIYDYYSLLRLRLISDLDVFLLQAKSDNLDCLFNTLVDRQLFVVGLKFVDFDVLEISQVENL